MTRPDIAPGIDLAAAHLPIRTWAEIEEEEEIRKGLALVSALRRADWSVTRAAAELGVRPSSLVSLIDTWGVRDLYRQHAPKRGRRPSPEAAARRAQRDEERAAKLEARAARIRSTAGAAPRR